MTNDQALELLRAALHGIAPEVDLDVIDPDQPLQEEIDIDSMDFLNLVTEVHARAGIEVPERDYPLIATLNGFAAYLVGAPAAP